MNEHDVAQSLQAYDIGRLREARPFDCDLRRPWRIATDRGEFVLKECHLNRTPQDLSFEHGLLAWLTEHQLPVSCPVETRSG